MTAENYKYGSCNGFCEACNSERRNKTHSREYKGIQSSIGFREIAQENPIDVNIPLTGDNELPLSEF